MGTKGTTSYRIYDQNALYFITTATVYWIDLFTRRRIKDILIESLIYCRQKKGLGRYPYKKLVPAQAEKQSWEMLMPELQKFGIHKNKIIWL